MKRQLVSPVGGTRNIHDWNGCLLATYIIYISVCTVSENCRFKLSVWGTLLRRTCGWNVCTYLFVRKPIECSLNPLCNLWRTYKNTHQLRCSALAMPYCRILTIRLCGYTGWPMQNRLQKKSVYPLYVLLNMKLKGVLARHAGVSTAYTYQPFWHVRDFIRDAVGVFLLLIRVSCIVLVHAFFLNVPLPPKRVT